MTDNPHKLLLLTESLRNQDNTGILLVDKPTAMTSHDVVAIARKKLDIKKIGHAGTLDPLATGLLILLVGRQYTKLQSLFLKQDKEYVCTARLGITTDSYDIDGAITRQTDWSQLSTLTQQDLETILPSFTGEIKQTVPIYSAVKIKGRKLYDLARKGQDQDVELPTRQVTIQQLDLLEFSKDEQSHLIHFTFKTTVSSGTYIRSLVADIGKALSVGATVTSLRRTRVGKLNVDNALSIEQI